MSLVIYINRKIVLFEKRTLFFSELWYKFKHLVNVSTVQHQVNVSINYISISLKWQKNTRHFGKNSGNITRMDSKCTGYLPLVILSNMRNNTCGKNNRLNGCCTHCTGAQSQDMHTHNQPHSHTKSLCLGRNILSLLNREESRQTCQ